MDRGIPPAARGLKERNRASRHCQVGVTATSCAGDSPVQTACGIAELIHSVGPDSGAQADAQVRSLMLLSPAHTERPRNQRAIAQQGGSEVKDVIDALGS